MYSYWATGLTAKEQWFDYLVGQETLLLPKATRLALGPIQSHIEWVMGIFPHYLHFPSLFFYPFTAFCEEFYSCDEGSEIFQKHGCLCAKIHGVKSQMTMILTFTKMMSNFIHKHKENCFITYGHNHTSLMVLSLSFLCIHHINT